MTNTNRTPALITGLVAVAALGATSMGNAAVVVEHKGDFCPGVCVDFATGGYDVSGGAVIKPAASIQNVALTPGSNTGDSADVIGYNVTSRLNEPEGASTPIDVINLGGSFELYWGSVDEFNLITFYTAGIESAVFDQFWGEDAKAAAGGAGNDGPTYDFDGYYKFTGEFDSVRLSSTDGVAFEVARVPEPGTLALLGLGLAGLGAARRRKSA